MPASDAEANRCLDLIVDDGGSWEVGPSTTVPALSGGVVTNVTDPGVPLLTLPRDGAATWDAAVGRRVMPSDGLVHDPAATAFVAVARVFYESGVPVRFARVTPVTVPVGGVLRWPPESLALDHD